MNPNTKTPKAGVGNGALHSFYTKGGKLHSWQVSTSINVLFGVQGIKP